MTVLRANQDIIGTMIFGAVFERHPQLRIVCVEADAGWAPHWMYRADHGYDRHRNWLTAGELSRRPSEWFAGNVYLTFQDDWVAFRTADLMNTDRLMWANDFPHSDATWPHSQELLLQHAMQLDEHARRRILHDNAAELYGITV
jgi:predicted TIM-barrel fold metal-dependent hydrolase